MSRPSTQTRRQHEISPSPPFSPLRVYPDFYVCPWVLSEPGSLSSSLPTLHVRRDLTSDKKIIIIVEPRTSQLSDSYYTSCRVIDDQPTRYLWPLRGLQNKTTAYLTCLQSSEATVSMAYHDHDRRSRQSHLDEYSPSTSGAATPITSGTAPSSYLHSSVSGLVSGFGGLVRRFSDMTSAQHAQQKEGAAPYGSQLGWPNYMDNNGINGVYTPPIHRSASPMGPPPLEPLQLKGFRDDTRESSRLLTPAVAEEIRIMIPERQRIDDEWNLVYSLDQDGASLGTLYEACSDYVGERASFVLVVRDNDGGVSNHGLSLYRGKVQPSLFSESKTNVMPFFFFFPAVWCVPV